MKFVYSCVLYNFDSSKVLRATKVVRSDVQFTTQISHAIL